MLQSAVEHRLERALLGGQSASERAGTEPEGGRHFAARESCGRPEHRDRGFDPSLHRASGIATPTGVVFEQVLELGIGGVKGSAQVLGLILEPECRDTSFGRAAEAASGCVGLRRCHGRSQERAARTDTGMLPHEACDHRDGEQVDASRAVMTRLDVQARAVLTGLDPVHGRVSEQRPVVPTQAPKSGTDRWSRSEEIGQMTVGGRADGLGDAQRKLLVRVIDRGLPERVCLHAGKANLELQRCAGESDRPQRCGAVLPNRVVEGPKGASVQRIEGGHAVMVSAER